MKALTTRVIEERLSDGMRTAMPKFLQERFGIRAITGWNLFSGRLVTTTPDHRLFKKHRDAMSDFEAGYLAAQEAVLNP